MKVITLSQDHFRVKADEYQREIDSKSRELSLVQEKLASVSEFQLLDRLKGLWMI